MQRASTCWGHTTLHLPSLSHTPSPLSLFPSVGGHHPSSCIDSHVRVFAFDTRDGRWAEVETAGEAPTRRGGHSVTMVRD